MKTPSDYKRLTTLAAERERAGHFGEAQVLWHQAVEVAVLKANRDWAAVRVNFCELQRRRLAETTRVKNGGEV